MALLTLQANVDGHWRDMAELECPHPELGADGALNFSYTDEHLARWLAESAPTAAASVNLPLQWGPTCLRAWPALLDDIRPLGSARSWWQRKLFSGRPIDDFELLGRGAIAPIGHLRIKEAVPPKTNPPLRFPQRAVVDRETAFLDYAAEHGVQVGGATGAGGDSPKLLLRLDADQQVWVDTWQDEPDCRDAHYLVKFARGQRTPRDKTILRSEYVYYRALAALGIDTISTQGMQLIEGEHGPSLWLPRFDVVRGATGEVRLGVESIYSVVGARPGAWLKHERVLDALRRVFPAPRFRNVLLEYLRRDLLNQVFGNTDNHGRNTSLLKSSTQVTLAPIYDFAPMAMDPEGITRTTKWENHERGGVDWPALLASFGPDEVFLREGLNALAQKLRPLPQLLAEEGLPSETLTSPGIGLEHTERKLREWTLL